MDSQSAYLKTKSAASKREATSVTVFTLCFALVGLQSLLSYPFFLMFGSEFCEVVENFSGGEHYMRLAFIVTIISFSTVYFAYRLTGSAKLVKRFQNRPFTLAAPSYYIRVWIVIASLVLVNCALLFHQSGYVLPLLQGSAMDATEYSIYRSDVSSGINVSVANLNAHLLVPTLIFISFVCIKKNNILFRGGAIGFLLLSACFSLNRSFLPVALLILLFIFVSYAPIPIHRLSRLIVPVVALTLVAFGLMVYSTKTSASKAASKMTDRVIHGQWLGMPLYLYYFEQHRVTPATFIHPLIRNALGLEVPATPGRELMEYFNPAGVEEGSAGNIPTYFVGEAYSVGGWTAVIASVAYVSMILWGYALAFEGLPKNYFTCCLYGWIVYKVACGLVCGISAFLVSSLTFILILLMIANVVYDGAMSDHRSHVKWKPASPTVH